MAGNNSSSPAKHPGRARSPSTALRLLIGVAAFFALLAVVAAFVIYPLWYLATQETKIYTIGALALVGALAVLFFLMRWRRAARNARLDDFYVRVMSFTGFLVFLLSQAFVALVNAVLYTALKSAPPDLSAIVLLHAAGCLAALASLALPFAALGRRLFGLPLFIVSIVLFSLQGAYWTAVFIAQGSYLFIGLVYLSILGFFFFKKLTKIVREKRSPRHETSRH
jgi:hypothetical protein